MVIGLGINPQIVYEFLTVFHSYVTVALSCSVTEIKSVENRIQCPVMLLFGFVMWVRFLCALWVFLIAIW